MNQSDFNKLNAGAPKVDTDCQNLAVTVNLEPMWRRGVWYLAYLVWANMQQVAREALRTWIQVAQGGLVLGLLGMGKYATSSKGGIAICVLE